MKNKKTVTEDESGRDPHDFYDFGPFRKASKAYLDDVTPEHVKKLIAERKKLLAKGKTPRHQVSKRPPF